MKWPHEATWTPPPPKVDELEENGRLLRHAVTLLIGMHFARSAPKKEEYSQRYIKLFFEMCNGPAIPVIEGKLQFTHDVLKLGYLAPKSVLIRPEQAARARLPDIEALDHFSSKRLCKPYRSSGGRGLYLAPSPEAAISFVQQSRSAYLIQNALPPIQGDFRYVFNRTPEDLRCGSPPSFRVAIERIGPRVKGDGLSTIPELIDRLPRSRKDREKLKIAAQNRVPSDGELVELVGSGNLTYPKWARLPCPEKLEHLDSVLTQFLADYERLVLGKPLAVFCADIGLTSDNGVVFYEFQLPFVSPYFYRLEGVPNRKAARKILWALMREGGAVARQLATS